MKIRFFSLLLSAAFLITVLFSGCGLSSDKLSDEQPIALIVLMGNHANSQKLDIQLDVVAKRVYSSFGNIGIVVVDGKPTPLYNEGTNQIAGFYNIEALADSKSVRNSNPIIWEREYLTPQINYFVELVHNCYADDPEVDTLKALQIASEILYTIEASMGTEVKKEIVILDTGLCTCGAMSFFQPEWLSLLMNDKKLSEDKTGKEKTADLIKMLDASAEIPNLSNITVTWYGLGRVCHPQPDLTNLNIYNLQYIWGELLKQSGAIPSRVLGADTEYEMFVPVSGIDSVMGECSVTPIINWEDLTEENTPKLTEEMLGFKPESSDFFSETQADQIIFPYASNLKNNPDMKVLLVGTTSSWKGGSVSLSEERAKTVCDKLIEAGVSADQISIIGLGYNLNFCKDDAPNGVFVETIAKENRAVFILPYNSEKAQIALKCFSDM